MTTMQCEIDELDRLAQWRELKAKIESTLAADERVIWFWWINRQVDKQRLLRDLRNRVECER